MKALFLLLVLLNLAYLGWQAWIVPARAPLALSDAEGVPRLVLIGEDPDDPAFNAPYTAPETLPDFPQPGAVEESAPQPEETAATQADAPDRPEAEERDRPETEEPGDEPDATVADVPAEVEVEVPAAITDAPEPVAVATASAGLRCVSLGPFLNLREATEATAMLIEAGLDPGQRLSESQVWFGHWVHLPPQENRAAAVRIVEDLRENGVSDIYIEPSGPLRNSISLGVFSDREHAETRAGAIRKFGISPQIRDRYRDSSVYWVDFEMPEGQVIDPTEFQASPRRVLRIEGRTCPENS